ncbi:PCI-domain-containing protein [Clavulina sp. PMI_390]|nr:PCI-domain-containing protein [Clavulina sp. PMI_390]
MEDDDMEYLEAANEDEDYDFQYSDDDGDDDEGGSADLENKYYQAKGLKEDDPDAAIKAFENIVTLEISQEGKKGDWGFKSLKQQIKLLFLTLNRPEDAYKKYVELLTYTKSAVTRNYSEKSINGILDYVGDGGKKKSRGGAAKKPINVEVLRQFYEATKASMEDAKNDRLSLKINTKLGKLWLDRREFTRLAALIEEMKTSVQSMASADRSDQSQQGTSLLEIYALEIQMHNETRNFKKLKEIYNATLEVRSAIPHPHDMGVIRECGGKMWMGEKQWSKASTDFFESFRNYDEAGSSQRMQVLKYLVLANMLMASDINPFDSQETKPYKNDPEILAMTNLVSAYQRRDVNEAEKILRDNKATIMDDPFIRFYIGDLLRSLRTQYLIDLIKPYTRLELTFLAQQLNVEKDEVEELLMGLILEGKVKGKIDQVASRLELESSRTLEKRRYNALEKWTESLESMQVQILGRLAAPADRSFGDFP